MFTITSLSDVLDIEHFGPFIRDFGAIACVAFVLLMFLLIIFLIVVFRQGKLLDEIDKRLEIHHAAALEAARETKSLSSALQSFRDSEKDIIANLREAMIAHSMSCEKGELRVMEMQRDIDTIGSLVERLVTVLTVKRRENGDDGNGKK